MEKGYIQVYTGNGKGKTTAALGLAIRAAASGMNVYIGQFIKGMHYSELDILEKCRYLGDHIKLKQYGKDCFIHNKPTEEDVRMALEGVKDLKSAMESGVYDVVIADEINIAVYFKLFSEDTLLDLMRSKPDKVELIITGRKATEKVIEQADLVTEMKEIKHYYTKGVQARVGIEK